MSMKWKTVLDEIPQGLGPEEFDDWLWKRKVTVQGKEQLVNLHDRETFPSFNDLPNELYCESDYFGYSDTNMTKYQPVRHWCFLAEIQGFDSFLRLRMAVKDVDGTTVPLLFHTNHRGNELAPSKIRKGYTVAILYAVCHAFMFSEPGIRHENPQMMKIFPLSLNRLRKLGKKFQRYSTEIDGVRICHGCGKEGISLKRCGKCPSFWYCNRVCQRADWTEDGHKAECNVLKDPDGRGILQLKWDEFDGQFKFQFA